jgi:hypothetical protein
MSLDGRDFWPRRVLDAYDTLFEKSVVNNYLGFEPVNYGDLVGKVSLLFVITDLQEAREIRQTFTDDGLTLFEGHSIRDEIPDWDSAKDVRILKVDVASLPVLFRFPDRAYEQYSDEYRQNFDEYGMSLDGDYDDSDWDFSCHVLVLPVECPQAPSSVFKVVR